ncbi:DUF3726 domain-containing protein [Pseudomonas piscis]|uniref:DUF3726 domain-containing protein n=1 Tax=Pseudomonas piscis TaxID=2614538 RepID=UPI0021D5A3B8|nr:DUF3726 domain-containing protein [Pseudomonas piscis]
MNASLNELESLCKKAARGAGLSWGLAEEAGKAARWLAAHGLDGAALLSAQLQQDDGCTYPQLAPQVGNGSWHVPGHWMCPLIAGASLCDHSYLLRDGTPLHLVEVASPELLLPFVSAAAQQSGLALELSWAGCSVQFDRQGKAFVHHVEGLGQHHAAQIVCRRSNSAEPPGQPLQGPLPPLAEAVQQALERLAARTYVPASEASRLLGAGAGLSDDN